MNTGKISRIWDLICLTAIPSTVHAVDGIVLINQSNAIQGNVTPGDTPGFPVTIRSLEVS